MLIEIHRMSGRATHHVCVLPRGSMCLPAPQPRTALVSAKTAILVSESLSKMSLMALISPLVGDLGLGAAADYQVSRLDE